MYKKMFYVSCYQQRNLLINVKYLAILVTPCIECQMENFIFCAVKDTFFQKPILLEFKVKI